MYYTLQWTWGIIMNIIGLAACGLAKLLKWPIQHYRKAIEIICPINFGGVSFGMFIIRGVKCNNVLPHEYGHSIQNIIFGPLFPFIIGIPSALRYWYREINSEKITTPYDAIWFEGWASKLGKNIEEGKSSWL